MANPVVHFEVLDKDATTLKNFYGGAFGPGLFSGLANHENNLRFSTGIVFKF